jgi:two-component system, NtrC family, sensor kinase
MKSYSRLSLKIKFLLFTSLIVVAICGGLFFFMESIFRNYLRYEMQQQAGEISLALQDQLLRFDDVASVQTAAERLLVDSREISRIVVYRRFGRTLQTLVKSEAVELPDNLKLYSTAVFHESPFRHEFRYNNKEYWEFAYPIPEGGTVVGLTTVTLNFSQYKVLISALRRGTLVILIIGLGVMLLCLSVYVEMSIRRPLAEIVDAMEKVKGSRFETRVKPHADDEIGKLANDFNEMTLALGEALQEVFRQNRMLEQRVQDATAELRSRNLELFRAQDELRRASRLATAGQVAAMLAHDLGSPLSSISGHLQLMLEDPAHSPEEKERLKLILSQVERLSDTIRYTLNNFGEAQAHFEECDLNALLNHLIQLTTPVLADRKIEPIVDLDPHLPKIRGDSNQLQQLFLNLFTNAIDAMKGGGQLKVTTRYHDGAVQVSVADTGIGMSREHLKQLFRPFFSTKQFGKGTGLGLAISKEIVKTHGGQIDVESTPGKGTEFKLLFPVSGLEARAPLDEESERVDRG